VVWDPFRVSPLPQRVSLAEFCSVQMFDGKRTLREIQAETTRILGGELLPLEVFSALVRRFDEALLLESPRLRQRLATPVRESSCIGCYEEDTKALREQVRELFTGRGGPGPPRREPVDNRLRAALVPHIDYQRGGVSYGWGFKEVFEHTAASLFVIIGTSHYSGQRFTLTRQNFKTPLGIVPTDQPYIDRLVEHYGDGLFEDEFAHIPEHSIELEVVLLQYLYEGHRRIRIVPLVVGPFQDCVDAGSEPPCRQDIRRMVDALRLGEQEAGEPVCYLISGDLAHIGPKFGDPGRLQDGTLRHSREQDEALLRDLELVDVAGYYRRIAAEGDARRICGLPPTYTALEAVRPCSARLQHYGQYVHPRGEESVSFASVAFYA
jgi:AmmeMemoRadiSam system protein B